MCPYFAAGNCLKGDSCDMLHPPPPAAPGVPRPKGEGKRSRSGKPNGKGNQGSEPKQAVSTQGGDPNNATACFQNSDGACPRGDNCPFAHRALTAQEEQEKKVWAKQRAESPAAKLRKPLRKDFMDGKCLLGKECPNYHPKGKGRGGKAKGKSNRSPSVGK